MKNEPAYPIFDSNGTPSKGTFGLSKRELIAAMAMQGFLANGNERFSSMQIDGIARIAIQCADELLSQLDKTKGL